MSEVSHYEHTHTHTHSDNINDGIEMQQQPKLCVIGLLSSSLSIRLTVQCACVSTSLTEFVTRNYIFFANCDCLLCATICQNILVFHAPCACSVCVPAQLYQSPSISFSNNDRNGTSDFSIDFVAVCFCLNTSSMLQYSFHFDEDSISDFFFLNFKDFAFLPLSFFSAMHRSLHSLSLCMSKSNYRLHILFVLWFFCSPLHFGHCLSTE